mmetsp:Transcript_11885/g.32160  ORF Transcript_11885/g.32160 Transcript_11885/m.32160 type:complete len:87 (+) Transcript_11885:449-709(+)
MTASDIEVWRCGKVGKGRGLAESLPAYLFSISPSYKEVMLIACRPHSKQASLVSLPFKETKPIEVRLSFSSSLESSLITHSTHAQE